MALNAMAYKPCLMQPNVIVSTLATCLKVCAVCLAVSISTEHAACRRPAHEEDELLKQALLGADVEAPASSKKKPWCGPYHKWLHSAHTFADGHQTSASHSLTVYPERCSWAGWGRAT